MNGGCRLKKKKKELTINKIRQSKGKKILNHGIVVTCKYKGGMKMHNTHKIYCISK